MNTELSHIHLLGRTVTLTLSEGRIVAIRETGGVARQVILPLPVDPHVHLDKTFTASRCPAPEPGLFGAIEAMAQDRDNWTEADLRARMTRALEEAYGNGIAALRSHVDWWEAGEPLAWSVLGEIAQDWRGRITVQRASLTPLDILGDPDHGPGIAEVVAQDRQVLGCFIYRHERLRERLERVFALAARHDLMLDFHVDEGLDAEATGFDDIVDLTARYGMPGRVLCGHACSLSIRPHADVARTIAAAAEASIALTVLPSTNLWLQDGSGGSTPVRRGLAPMHELRAAGVSVLLGADNVADPFYRMGSYDALDVLRLASVAGHLNPGDWLGAITTDAARALGLEPPAIAPNAPADFILQDGSDYEDALRDPRARRQIVRAGGIETLGKEAA